MYVITSVYPSDYNKYSGIFVKEQCLKLKDIGYKVVVLHAHSVNYKEYLKSRNKSIKHNNIDGIDVIELNCLAFKVDLFPLLNANIFTIAIKKIFKYAYNRLGKPNLIHAHFSLPAGYSACIISGKYKIPYVVTEHHTLLLDEHIHKENISMLKRVVSGSSKFICVSDLLKHAVEKWINHEEKKIIVIPNMINIRYTYSPPPKSRIFRFLSVGSLIKRKKMNLIIEAFCLAFNKNDNVKLNIIGDGPERNSLLSLIRDKKREQQIFLLGSLSVNEVYENNVNSNVFVLASECETFGIVYREALAVGRPIISTKNGGVEENWNKEYGYLVDKNDKVRLVDAMKQIYAHYDKFNYRYISQECLKLFSSSIVVSQISEVYKKIEKD
ncbi:glycosyltransferase [Clostridium sp.]